MKIDTRPISKPAEPKEIKLETSTWFNWCALLYSLSLLTLAICALIKVLK